MSNQDAQLVRENQRREELSRQRRQGLAGNNPAEQTRWEARDEASTRRFSSPDGEL